MKKTIAILLTVMMLLGMLAGCGGQKTETVQETPAAPAEEKTPEATAEPAEETTTGSELEPVQLTWYIGWAQNTTDS